MGMSQIVMWPRHQGKADKPGFVYALEFSSGAVKVGRATNYKARQRQHYVNAKVHDHRITDSWCVWVSDGQKRGERRAIDIAYGLNDYAGRQLVESMEWWRGVPFEPLVAKLEDALGKGTRRSEFPDLYREDWLAQYERNRLVPEEEAA